MTLTQLIAVRHGESVGNVAREAAEAEQADRITVDLRDPDVPLSDRGRSQAAAVGRWLAEFAADHTVGAVWSSPYVRAHQTAEIALDAIGSPVRVRIDERLRDRELGILDLLTGRGVHTLYPEEAVRRRWLGKMYYRPPGGESWSDVALRLRSFLLDVERRQVDGPVLLFCHDAVIMLLRYVLEELTEAELFEIARNNVVSNGSVTRFAPRGDGSWELLAFDERQHLLEEGAPPTEHDHEVDDVRP